MSQIVVELPYGTERIRFSVPARNFMGVYAPSDVPISLDTKAIVTSALANPIGAPPLHELARGAERVLLVANDNTRPMPTHSITPILLHELSCAGVCDAAIEVLIALGTHRKMSASEIAHKFGPELLARV